MYLAKEYTNALKKFLIAMSSRDKKAILYAKNESLI